MLEQLADLPPSARNARETAIHETAALRGAKHALTWTSPHYGTERASMPRARLHGWNGANARERR